MSQDSGARARAAVFVRALRVLLLAAALVCASAARPAVSPAAAPPLRKGSVIAFVAGGAVYVTDADGGKPIEVVGDKDGVNMQSALSPDGSRVAFSSKRDGKFSIYVVGVDGKGLRRLTDGPGDDSEPAWSPDGRRIAFVRGFDATGSGVVVLTCLSGDILTVGVDDGAAEVNLTQGSGGTDPTWSPDGRRIAFASDRAGSYDIYTMSSDDGGDVRRLTEDRSDEADPSWSPDGSWIAYTGGLRAASPAQCGNMPIVGAPTEEEGDQVSLARSPYLYRMAADGSQQLILTGAGHAAEPDWSPDGSRIIFVGGHEDGGVEIYLTAADGTGPRVKLTSDSAQESSPSWAGAAVP